MRRYKQQNNEEPSQLIPSNQYRSRICAAVRYNKDVYRMKSLTKRIALFSLIGGLSTAVAAFQSENRCFRPSSGSRWGVSKSLNQRTVVSRPSTSSTELFMVFDFFKQRSTEGLEQIAKLSESASKGKLGEGLSNAASYTRKTNQAFAEGLAKSRNRFLNNLERLFTGASSEEEMLEELQDVLLQADLGMATAEDIVKEVQSLREISEESAQTLSREDLMSIMRGKLIEILDLRRHDDNDEARSCATDDDIESPMSSAPTAAAIRFAPPEDKIPTVILVMGANGMGKTTTIGKLAYRLRTEGNQTVLMAACDTFRAGAVDQLQLWADRAEVEMYGPNDIEKTPTTIVAGAIKKALKEGYDTVLVDTAGRLSNNWELTEELVNMKLAIQQILSSQTDNNGNVILYEDVPHESLLVLDAAQGRIALDSSRIWNKEVGLTGLILTKLDGSARGGSVVAISRELNLPVKLIGVGEGIDDLRDFEAEKFVDGLLGIGAAGGKASTSEGAILASRLEKLRNERAARVPQVKKKAREPVAAGSSDGSTQRDGLSRRNTGNKRRNRRKKGKQ
ncbi:signal recognition particle-docking protein FtsY [Nitzschia inconspicua]|uniref:Signal recognition particle-docking protein FtsY n=1 Tax=Nitzschia inconspicua TaxID=303405 RepID=A0A9K3LNQ3_9STRA|nr:signal recognition particle-docking protein FtsY [Nitzschia inconspicua]KAG7364131.1 signal recognition particle-docking protein FtsY [Nitzschia inconspicua]